MKHGSIVFTVDIEDWYQVENLKEVIPRETWASRESRVEKNVQVFLDLLDESKGEATFFVLGNIAQRYPGLVKTIHNRGHEVASHGSNHELIYHQSHTDFGKDIKDSKYLLEDLTGEKVIGYRAPSFSITDWSVDILKECGYIYDSSVFPFRAHDRYGLLHRPLLPSGNGISKFENGLIELSLSILKIRKWYFPWSGGGYFRMIPYPIFSIGIRTILERNDAFVFYIHPWEIDWQQPRIGGVRRGHRFRHYVNLHSTMNKLKKLSNEFTFITIREALKKAGCTG